MSKTRMLRMELVNLFIKNKISPTKGITIMSALILELYLTNELEPEGVKKYLDSFL